MCLEKTNIVDLAATFQKDVLIFVTLKFRGFPPITRDQTQGFLHTTTELSLVFSFRKQGLTAYGALNLL